MRKNWTVLIVLAVLGSESRPVLAQTPGEGYRDHRALESAIDQLARANRDIVEITEVARSAGNRTIRAIRLAAGDDADGRPALLVMANVYGPHVVGSEIAMNVASMFVGLYGTDSSVTELLDSRTVYIIPRVNPDAAEGFFRRPLVERVRNDGSSDDDHDWEEDEDGPDDLNGDGLITMMRVRDPAGEWIPDSANPALMRKAEREKGEVGMYRVLTEGRDDDGDESWNEDPPGDTDVNSNFSYGYDYFGTATGVFQMSAPETRGVADFFVSHPNIAAVYVLGPEDNLLDPWEHKSARGIGGNAEGTSAGGPFSSILEADQPYFEQIGVRFEETTGLDDGPNSAELAGDALSWSYYHMGRWAFGSRVWWIPDTPAASEESDPDESEADDDEAGEAAGDDSRDEDEETGEHDSLKAEYNAYRWITENVAGGFVEWTRFDHPDFPGREVEIGGFAPYVRINPPPEELDSLSRRQMEFVAELAGALPQIELRNVSVEQVGQRTYRIEAEVANNGYFPTLAAIGVKAFWPRRIRVELDVGSQEIIGGRSVQLVGPIAGSGASQEFGWVVVGQPGAAVTLTVSSPVAGTASETLRLR